MIPARVPAPLPLQRLVHLGRVEGEAPGLIIITGGLSEVTNINLSISHCSIITFERVARTEDRVNLEFLPINQFTWQLREEESTFFFINILK